MEKNYFQKSNLNIRDKILALDFLLIFLVLSLGLISFFAMYSSEQGKVGYYTLSHIYRFSAFFIVFIMVSFFKIQFWYKSSYLFYFIILILLFIVDFFGLCFPVQHSSKNLEQCEKMSVFFSSER